MGAYIENHTIIILSVVGSCSLIEYMTKYLHISVFNCIKQSLY